MPEAPESMCATSVIVFDSPAAKGPRSDQVIRPADAFATGVAETKLIPVGIVSITVTGLSMQSPVFVTFISYVTSVPGAPSVSVAIVSTDTAGESAVIA